ncbi:S-adenosyl-L-methionine-dependent methyltransferase [Dunaliella salina]|uniref:S-adenosyl-L-methionine-dependent methyltransferase n=1 Tax=Dunaliella salina TaxID=3046 RepID=A0ABQ7GFX1_DUNSA|nr:S-adenosyl-L-methionine-dependent methyltransferase [Dunaliella salina]|eukprot:KAF5833501.1 S-adenosyl-L-methionine-dependent methyltransferase [Dunaliella salina]
MVPVVLPMQQPVDQPSANPGYSHACYWDNRYSSKPTTFDWFFTYGAIGGVLCSCLPKDLPCLHVGCGNSTLQDGMSKDGFLSVTNVDISPVVIDQLRLHPTHGNAYDVVDCRDMQDKYSDGSFGGVLDKGTLDAVLCCKGGHADVVKYCKEVSRILAPRGIFLLISLGTPKARAKFLDAGMASWSIEVLLLPKPSGFYQTEAMITGRQPSRDPESRAGVDRKDAPVRMHGPFSMAEASGLIGEDPDVTAKFDPNDYFFAYVCRKQGSAKEKQPEQQQACQPEQA